MRSRLNRTGLSTGGKATSVVDFGKGHRQPGLRTVCAWTSTYADCGPESWITRDLLGSPEHRDSDKPLIRRAVSQ